ncbi:glycosyltransferase family 4 protein [Rhizohabitans arisaemae]|uniref:glycosyltransferase family 4 protein n=1 Tax=Rhizohabitans arisaemae TaxID=2720610 RepID=UPI0024B08A31|nr:glycosyltransferase family 4 protein [Rhizohabitans arisaemae]
MSRILFVTNDFPPRPGGIQVFVHALTLRRPPGSVVVYAPAWRGAAAFDARQPYPVIRHPSTVMLPVGSVARRAARIAARFGCDTVVFGAALPLGLLAPELRKAGIRRIIAISHGHEAGWASWFPATRMLRRIGSSVDVITYLGEYTRVRLARAVPGRTRLARLAPGVDTRVFRPGAGGAVIRRRYGLGGRPVVVCVSRLVPRKGQDTLIRCWPRVLARVPEAALLVVGGGPYRRRLERLAATLGVGASVTFAGSVPWSELPAHYDAGDVFAMPCRTRLFGLDVEGLGIVYLEAAATGLPVVAGASGGAPDAVLPGETGHVVDGRSPDAVAGALVGLLTDEAHAKAMGEKGRAWIEREWHWDLVAERFACLLDG